MSLFSRPKKSLLKLTRKNNRQHSSHQRQLESLSSEARALAIDALYLSPLVTAFGIGSGVFAALFCFALSLDVNYLLITATFVLCGSDRYWKMYQYQKYRNSKNFSQWKALAIQNGIIHCVVLGLFCAYTIFAQDQFNQLIAISLTLGNLVGLPSRNFSSKRMVRYQLIAVGAPMATAFFLQPMGKYWMLAILLIPMFWSITLLADRSRETLLQVISRKVELKQLLTRFDTATNFMQHGFLIIDDRGNIVVANGRALQLLAVETDGTWIGEKYQSMLEQSVRENRLTALALDQLSPTVKDTRDFTGTLKALVKTCDNNYLESSASYCEGQLVVLLEDVTERIRSADRITYMATHDTLTGLWSREHFHDLFRQHLNQRADGQCMLAVIDLDNFKHINDTYGHAAGDELLCSAATTIEKICADYAIACRFGGDEFVIFAPSIADTAEAEAFIQWLLSGLSNRVQLSHGCVQSTASIGLVVESHSTATSDGMFAKADLALYESKAKARGSWTTYVDELDANYRQRQMLKDELLIAIERDELTVNFQPIVNLNTRQVRTFEALSRWTHPQQGEISPTVFIPLAEDMGIIGKITLIVLKKSIHECCKWPSDVGVSVNLSAIDFNNFNLVDEIDKALWSAKLEPSRLEVEITESTFIENKKRVVDTVIELRKLGVRIALDDFGTGYSNFSYLQDISVSKLKIDRCFVKDILKNERSSLLLSGISDIAKRLSMSVTVEGIETTEQLEAVQKVANVDDVQGWVFSKAVTAEQALTLASHVFSATIEQADIADLKLDDNIRRRA